MRIFDIDIHIFTVIKFLFNLVVKFKYIQTRKTTRKGKQNGTENEELVKVVVRREEKWKENAETEQKEKREGTA